MAEMTEEEKSLRQVNADTFAAEEQKNIGDQPWDKFLWRVLSDDFRIRRANPAVLPQDKHRMIAHIAYGGTPPVRNIDEKSIRVFSDGVYGVVTCVLTLEGKPERYHNLKVFTRKTPAESWQCVYWRVTELPPIVPPGG